MQVSAETSGRIKREMQLKNCYLPREQCGNVIRYRLRTECIGDEEEGKDLFESQEVNSLEN